jgi:hypothetical protein
VFDQRAGGGEPARVATLGQDCGRAERGHSRDGGDQLGQLQFVDHAQHAGLGVGESAVGVGPVLEQQRDAFQSAGAVRVNTSRVGQCGEDAAGDAQAGFLPALPGDVLADRGLEPGPPQPPGAGQVATIALDDNAQRGDPGMRPERLLRAFQHRRPNTMASKLTCPAFPGLDNKAALRAAVESCLQHLNADLGSYTTAMSVDDVNEVLSALHYQQVNLVGISYGTTAEQTFLLRHPARVRTITLLSGTLLTIPVLERIPQNAQLALDNIFAECAAEPSCHQAFPTSARTGRHCGTRSQPTHGWYPPVAHPTTNRPSTPPTGSPVDSTRP